MKASLVLVMRSFSFRSFNFVRLIALIGLLTGREMTGKQGGREKWGMRFPAGLEPG